MRDFFIHCRRLLVLVLSLAGLASAADRTLMWLPDWYGGNLDSVEITSVSIQHVDPVKSPNGFYYGNKDLLLAQTKAYAPPIKVNQRAPATVQVPKTLNRWWYALPKYNANNFREGRMNIELKFNKFEHTYWNPPKVDIQTGASNGQTGELNWADPSKTNWPNQCLDRYPNDTIWFYNQASPAQFTPLYNADADTVISQGYAGNGIVCSDHNPFFVKVGTVHVFNPWPGSKVHVQQGGAWRPLFDEDGRLGWQTATIWADPRGDTTFKVRLASGNPATNPGVQYMDLGGLGANANGSLFDFSDAQGSHQWILPPTSSTGTPSVATSAPPVKTTLMIQKPDWTGGVRVLWKGNDSRFVASASPYCDWYTMPLYEGAIPDTIVLRSAVVDTLYGMSGLKPAPTSMANYQDWIAVKGQKIVDDTIWITTNGPFAIIPTVRPDEYLKNTCDTKVLAFSSYDYTDNEDSTSATWYAPFAEKYSYVNFPASAGASKAGKPTEGDYSEVPAKGIVKTTLNARGLPEWTGKVIANIGEESHGPQYWYDSLWRATDGTVSATFSAGATALNAFHCVPVKLKLDPNDGYYKFRNDNFFPLDTAKSIPSPYRWLNTEGNNGGHNFHYAMHAKATFEYTKGLKFKFTGDDDVWIFINKKLALDLGGMHGPLTDSINLDKLSLTEGKSYQFDMFYNERHVNGSSMSIQTTMNLVPTVDYIFDTTQSSGSSRKVKVLKSTTFTPADVCPENGATQQVDVLPARAVVYLLYPDGRSIQVEPGAVPGIAINDLRTEVEIDTTVLKGSGFLSKGGEYQIKVTTLDASESDGDITVFNLIATSVEAVGTLFDRNGDGRADSVFVHGDGATRSFYKTFDAAIRWGGTDSTALSMDSVKLGADDTTLAATFAPLPVQTACPDGNCVGSMGHIWALSTTTDDTVRNPIVTLLDGIAPIADSAWLVYDTTGTGMDTLYVRASEGVAKATASAPAATAGWALLGNATSPRLLTEEGTTSGRIVAIPLDPQTNPFAAGDSVRLGSLAADLSGNAPASASVWVPVAATPHAKAWMLDRNGDGMPDSIGISGKSNLETVASVKVRWKTADEVDTSFVVATPGGITSGLKLPVTTLANATACKGCTIELSYENDLLPPVTARLLDSVAAVAVKAVLITAGDGEPDTLEVRLSEGIRTGYADYVRLSSDSAGTASGLTAASVTDFALEGRVLRLILQNGSVGPSLDWLRLAAGVQDSAGATVGTASKWVPLKVRPSGSANLYDTDGDGRADSIQFTVRGSIAAVLASSSTPVTDAILSWKDVDGRTVTRSWSLEGNTGSSFGLHPTDETLWFPFGATSCPGSNCTIALGEFEWPLLDQVAPIALSGSYRFGKGGASDTLRVRLSEPLSVVSSAPVWFEFGTEEGLYGPVSHASATLSFKGDSAFVLVPSAAGPSTEVTSIRLASGSEAGKLVDRATKTKVGATSPWAALSFGLRPLKLTVGTQPSLRSNAGENAWPVPTAGTPQLEILVRQAGSSAAWQSVTGGRFASAVVNDTAHLVGLLLTVNRPLTGALYVYDHLGISVGMISLESLSQAWKADAAAQDKVREVWIGWNGTGKGNQFVGSGVYLMRLVGVFQNEDGSTEVRNLVQKVGWQKK